MNRRAFSLIEILVSMTVLVVLVTLAAMLYANVEQVWRIGKGQSEQDRAGRAALGMLVHDLQNAVADTNLTFVIQADRSNSVSYGVANDEICFVSLQSDPSETYRVAEEIHYWIQETGEPDGGRRYELLRGCRVVTNGAVYLENCYTNRNWYEDPPDGAGRPAVQGVVAENVAALRFGAVDSESGSYESAARVNRLPQYVDVLLEILNERAARQGTNMPLTFVEQNVKRYATRVFFHNRNGYRER